MNNSIILAKRIAILVGDFVILHLSLLFSLLIRNFQAFDLKLWRLHLVPFSLVYSAWLIIFYINNLYELRKASNKPIFYQAMVRSFLICALLTIAFFYFLPKVAIAPKTLLFINLVLSFGLLYLWRNLFNKTIKSNRLRSNVAIIGVNEESLDLAGQINAHPQMGYNLVSLIGEKAEDVNNLKIPENIKSRNDWQNLTDIIEREKIEILIIGSNIYDNEGLQKILFSCLPLNVNFVDLPTFYETVTGKIPLRAINQVWFLENITNHKKNYYNCLKRIFDFTFAAIIFIPSLLIAPIIAAAIKLESRGSVIFKQKRTGKNGEIFMAMKFRSMRVDAEINGPQWAQKNDPRITRVGKWLRKTRLDEIPQLVNIIRGEMSFVGPRPERPEFIFELEKEIPFYHQRLLVKPGLTGWAQIEGPAYGGSKQESLEKLQYDLFYIKNYSPFLDLGIILKTINTVLRLKGQ